MAFHLSGDNAIFIFANPNAADITLHPGDIGSGLAPGFAITGCQLNIGIKNIVLVNADKAAGYRRLLIDLLANVQDALRIDPLLSLIHDLSLVEIICGGNVRDAPFAQRQVSAAF